MDYDDVRRQLMAYGADPSILDEYACVVDCATIVRDVVKLSGPYGTFALKKVYIDKGRLEYIHQVTEHLLRCGHESVPRMLKTRYGDAYVVHPSGLYYMTDWRQGRCPPAQYAHHIIALARELGIWHRHATGFYGSSTWYAAEEDRSLIQRLTEGKKALGVIRDSVIQDEAIMPFPELIRAHYETIANRLDEVTARAYAQGFVQMEADARSRGFVCHGAYTVDNVLYHSGKYHIRNYDHVHPGVPLFELTVYIHRYMPLFDWNVDVLDAILDAYAAGIGEACNQSVVSTILLMPIEALQLIEGYVNRMMDWGEYEFAVRMERELRLLALRERAAEELVRG
ncbi:hypothetical protein [Alicyclobacillus fastidiosus]|uniref:Aminoglycoside phosphotransferase domain-containing protein n=1 Tax=Alicyclobacillus fastidiosus TaxID=392011 RepID=A0ABV5AFP2_9BACL|nr:hypothetical protein [Alicyclobacillus fastidiosus]WEH11663.1 hypothetical protein PYS47_10875 [Alicyclobacillus fastidiosus]